MLKWNGGGNPTTLIMKKYKILQDTVANGSKVHAGDVVELDEVIHYVAMARQKFMLKNQKLNKLIEALV